jgi:cysteine desulfurase/selenocysteine lyase
MSIEWDLIRTEEFPATSTKVQLKAAGGSPLSKSAYEQVKEYYDELFHYGDIFWERNFKKIEKVRSKVAEYLHAKTSEIGFLINTSSCMNTIIHYLDVGEVLYPSHEFPASIHAIQRRGLKLKTIQPINNKFILETIEETIDEQTTTLITSHIQYLTGFRQNLQETGQLCKKKGLRHVVNATQSFGAYPIDVVESNIDLLAASGLKWACTGYGVGILYIKEPLLKNHEIPLLTGWLSVKDPAKMDPYNIEVQRRAKTFDAFGGAPHFPYIFALDGSLKLLEKIGKGNLTEGVKRVKERIMDLSDYLITRLDEINLNIISPIEKKYRSGIITIDTPKAEKITQELEKKGILVSCRRNPNTGERTFLRISLNFYNNTNDIDTLIKEFKKIGYNH